jgi:hypothetical protein
MIDIIAVIQWVLIAFKVGAGVVLTAIGVFLGLCESVESERRTRARFLAIDSF